MTNAADTLYVYVAGELGQHTPWIVAYSLETAMIRLLESHTVGGSKKREISGYPEQWTCGFIDGETGDLLWTLTIESCGTHHLYVRKCDVMRDKWDEDTGWRV